MRKIEILYTEINLTTVHAGSWVFLSMYVRQKLNRLKITSVSSLGSLEHCL